MVPAPRFDGAGGGVAGDDQIPFITNAPDDWGL
jgi:hypothetical protein